SAARRRARKYETNWNRNLFGVRRPRDGRTARRFPFASDSFSRCAILVLDLDLSKSQCQPTASIKIVVWKRDLSPPFSHPPNLKSAILLTVRPLRLFRTFIMLGLSLRASFQGHSPASPSNIRTMHDFHISIDLLDRATIISHNDRWDVCA